MPESDRVQYKFMIPVDLKRELEASASEARRSLSAEIITRLYDSLADLPSISEDPLTNELSRLEAEKASKSNNLRELSDRIAEIDEDIETILTAISARELGYLQSDKGVPSRNVAEVPDPDPKAEPDDLLLYVLDAYDDAEMKVRAAKANKVLVGHPDHVFIQFRDEFARQSFPAKVALAYFNVPHDSDS